MGLLCLRQNLSREGQTSDELWFVWLGFRACDEHTLHFFFFIPSSRIFLIQSHSTNTSQKRWSNKDCNQFLSSDIASQQE